MRRRLRPFILITGTTLCVLIAAAFVVSAWWEVAVQIPTSLGPAILLSSGSTSVHADDMWADTATIYRHSEGLSWWNNWGWGVEFWVYVELPLYAVFLAVAVPTLLIWRFVPKFPRGHCRRCGYNLTGLTEARCPECGTEFPKGDGACG